LTSKKADGRPLRSTKQVANGDIINSRLADGLIVSRVIATDDKTVSGNLPVDRRSIQTADDI
jgi:hypothetical protein